MSEDNKVIRKDSPEGLTAKPKQDRKVNKTSEPDVEKVSLKELDEKRKTESGRYRNTPSTNAEVAKAEEEYRKGIKLEKDITVRTVRSDGNMYYFDAGMYITHRPVLAPDSSWLQLQIKSGKIEKV